MAFQDTRAGEEAPVVTKTDDLHGDTVSHPAFAQIGVSRVSGHTSLYDSDFDHQHYMTIRICRSELSRNVGRDWHFGHEEYIEVALSEAQWATFVSSPNQGSGVPCTLQHLMGKRAPGIPLPDRTPQFSTEATDTLKKAMTMLEEVRTAVGDLGISQKKTGALISKIDNASMQLRSNLPFVEKSFGEHMEKTVEKAKAEIHGYMTSAIQRAGLEALTAGKLPLAIEMEKPDAE